MLDSVFADLELPRATMHRTLTHYATTGAASIPITLGEAARVGAFTPGDLILMAGFGGGMSAGFALIEPFSSCLCRVKWQVSRGV